mmetsp:Transcript_35533/g.71138  ORF Transcript_35533/g.71138 Transcript_35533/m.71138 type:complete len:384 (-) Transcript_35533:197-1348(-)
MSSLRLFRQIPSRSNESPPCPASARKPVTIAPPNAAQTLAVLAAGGLLDERHAEERTTGAVLESDAELVVRRDHHRVAVLVAVRERRRRYGLEVCLERRRHRRHHRLKAADGRAVRAQAQPEREAADDGVDARRVQRHLDRRHHLHKLLLQRTRHRLHSHRLGHYQRRGRGRNHLDGRRWEGEEGAELPASGDGGDADLDQVAARLRHRHVQANCSRGSAGEVLADHGGAAHAQVPYNKRKHVRRVVPRPGQRHDHAHGAVADLASGEVRPAPALHVHAAQDDRLLLGQAWHRRVGDLDVTGRNVEDLHEAVLGALGNRELQPVVTSLAKRHLHADGVGVKLVHHLLHHRRTRGAVGQSVARDEAKVPGGSNSRALNRHDCTE